MPVTTPCHTLFVYGTLRRRCGHPMALRLASRGTFCGEGKVSGRLFDLGRYPAAVPSNRLNEWVFGDLYEIDDATLAELDDYEGVESPKPAYFGREFADVTLADGSTRSALVYWYHGPLPANAMLIATGRYEKVFAH